MLIRGTTYWNLRDVCRAILGSLFSKLQFSMPQGFVIAIEKVFGVSDFAMFGRARVAFLHLLIELGAEPGQKIILPPITIRPMLDVALSLGLEPIFCEVRSKGLVFDEREFERAIRSGAKYCLVTPLFGLSADCSKLLRIAERNNVTTIVDVSQVTHSTFGGKPVWTGFDYALASFSALKTIDSLGGGLLFSPKSHDLAGMRQRAALLPKASRSRLFAFSMRNLLYFLVAQTRLGRIMAATFPLIDSVRPGILLRFTGSRGLVVREVIDPGFSDQYSDFQASIATALISQSERVVLNRREIALEVRDFISAQERENFSSVCSDSDGESDFWQNCVYVKNPHFAQRALWKLGVDTASTSLSFLPKAEFPSQENLGEFPVAEKIYSNTIFLPTSLSVSPAQLRRLKNAIRSFAEHVDET